MICLMSEHEWMRLRHRFMAESCSHLERRSGWTGLAHAFLFLVSRGCLEISDHLVEQLGGLLTQQGLQRFDVPDAGFGAYRHR